MTRAVIFKIVDSRQLGIITILIIWFLDADQRLLICALILGYQILLSTIKVFLSFKWKKFNFVKQISDLILCIVVLNWTKVHEWLINGGLNSRLYGCAILCLSKNTLTIKWKWLPSSSSCHHTNSFLKNILVWCPEGVKVRNMKIDFELDNDFIAK